MANRAIVLSDRPAAIKADVVVDPPYPRHRPGGTTPAGHRPAGNRCNLVTHRMNIVTKLSPRRAILAAVPGLIPGSAISRAKAAPANVLPVGTQTGAANLMAQAAWRSGSAAQPTWDRCQIGREFQFGPPLLEAMRIGSIELGRVGNTTAGCPDGCGRLHATARQAFWARPA